MSCWVVPALAAEYLGTSLDELLYRVRLGALPSKTENGFTFVDVAPEPHCGDGPAAPTPPTFVEITAEERAALEGSNGAVVLSEKGCGGATWASVRQRMAGLRRRCAN